MNKGTSGFLFAKLGVVAAAICVALFGISSVSHKGSLVEASASGPSSSHTGAPGETTCTECHTTFPLNSGAGSLTITGIPANYKPGQQIPVTVTISDPAAIIFGSQTTAIDATGQQAGTFTVPPGNPPTMQVIGGNVGGHSRDYIEHTVDGVIPTQIGTKSWTFTWTAPARRVGKVGFYTASNAANSDGTTNDDYIYATSTATLSGSALSNFDNDGKSDVAVYRPSTGVWYMLNSTDSGVQVTGWGLAGDKIVPGDYDGDGKTDFAVWRPSNGTWYILKSSGGVGIAQFGSTGDIPVPGDYDGDLKTDFAVWHAATATWYVLRSSDGAVQTFTWGSPSDKPVQADYDGDGKADFAVYRPSNGNWFIWKSATSTSYIANWGLSGDMPVPGDFDSDGKTDLAVYRPSTGVWYSLLSRDNGVGITGWGSQTDVPVPADYDGDGKTDAAVYRNGVWYVLRTSDNMVNIVSWGLNGDLPVPSAYLPQ
ncbi:MAG: choice-of-anchor V domain-containing protein [Acidobacteriota bacterium]